jgi:hypothetical protein
LIPFTSTAEPLMRHPEVSNIGTNGIKEYTRRASFCRGGHGRP